MSKEVNEHHVDLLLVANNDMNHYCFIKDFGRLVGSQYSSSNNKTQFCCFCLHGFSRNYTSRDKSQHRRTDEEMKDKSKKHEDKCFAFAVQRTEFPDEPIVKFGNIQKHHLQFMQILKAFLKHLIIRNISLVLMHTKLLVTWC